MIRLFPARSLLATLAALAAALSASAALSVQQQVKILQANVDQAFLHHYLHDNQKIVHAAGGGVRNVGVRIVRATGRAFNANAHFYEMGAPEVNATTSPGGNIFLYKGLLGIKLTDDELAAVLSHEIGHILRMHWLQRLQRNVNAQKLAQYTAKTYGRDSAEITYLQQQIQNLQYNRNEEFEADQVGATLMVTAGFKPEGMISLLNKVGANMTPQQVAAGSNPYLASHPAIPDRIARLQQLIQSGAIRPIKKRLY